jgi:hypothetical protein
MLTRGRKDIEDILVMVLLTACLPACLSVGLDSDMDTMQQH